MKKILLVIGIPLLILVAVAFYFFYLGKARENSEDKLREDNPLFHSVSEGGVCRPGEGDCAAGLTCGESNICVKP